MKKNIKLSFSSQSPFIPFCTGDWISALCFSPTHIGCISNFKLWLFLRKTGRLIFKTEKKDGAFVEMFFDPGNQDFLYTLTRDNIRVLNTKTTAFLECKIDKRVTLSTDIGISPKGTYLICRNTALDHNRLWFKEVQTLKPINDYYIPSYGNSYAIDPNEKTLAATDCEGCVFLFEIKEQGNSYQNKIRVSDRAVFDLTFSCDSKKILFTSDGEIGVLDVFSEMVCFSKKPANMRGSIIWVGFGSTEEEIFIVTAQGEFIVLGRESETISFINSASFSGFHILSMCLLCKKTRRLIIATNLGHIEVFDINRRDPILVPWSGAYFLEFLNNEGQTVIGSMDGTPVFWDFRIGIARRLNVQTKSTWMFCWLKKQNILVASTLGGSLYGFNPFESAIPFFFKQMPGRIKCVIKGREGEFLVFSGHPQTIFVLDGEGNILREKKTKAEEFVAVHWNPQGFIHTIDSSGTFVVRDYNTLGILKRTQRRYFFHSSAFLSTEAGAAFVPTRDEKAIEIFSLPNYKKVDILSGHESQVANMAISKGGGWLASADEEGVIFFWKKKKNEIKYSCTAVHHNNGVPFKSLNFSMDGKTLGAVGLAGVKFFRRYNSQWKKVNCKYPRAVEPSQ